MIHLKNKTMKNQTAVDWLVEEITKKHDKHFEEYYKAEIEQAKEIEKEQMIEFGEAMQEIYYYRGGIRFEHEPKKYFEENYE
jgi:hypothetical protein